MFVRLQRVLADAGIASRRGSEEIIRSGRVTVNGKVIREMGTKVDPGHDRVAVDGAEVKARRKLYIALNKPTGYVSSRSDPHGRRTIGELLPKDWANLYTVGRLDYNTEGLIFLTNDGQVYPYDHSHNSEGAGGFSENLFVKEYTLTEQLHAFAGFFDTFTVMYPQLQGIDFRTDATHLTVPVYLIEGRFEAPGRLGPAKEWFNLLDAPAKELITFDTSGHRPLFEQPDLFAAKMRTLLAETS